MESSSSSKKKKKQAAEAACSGRPAARPHWRRRDPADTSVYVVHPAQFRAVVEQLTGAAASSSPPPAPQPHQHQGSGNGAAAAAQQQTQPAAAGTAGTGSTQQQHGSRGAESSSGAKTLGQMRDECMAWANADD
ncbi:hypothetical protein PVAP13_9NG361900 [Panicum virgatum]|uniref:VQ domain-containing protein n=1 Tax=Panicum virgatum TaxID=38727 RepID=A0A8T0MVB2_PANVG|nr:hypothetical protein PVAP13_9NG361900 [Panicum virgatum]